MNEADVDKAFTMLKLYRSRFCGVAWEAPEGIYRCFECGSRLIDSWDGLDFQGFLCTAEAGACKSSQTGLLSGYQVYSSLDEFERFLRFTSNLDWLVKKIYG